MFWDIFYDLCRSNNKNPTIVVKELSMAMGNITKWKNGTTPSGKNLQKISDYFGVSVDYLLGAENEPEKPEVGMSETITLDNRNLCMVPLYESVSAGFGAYASNNIEDYMPAYFHNPSEAGETICIRVRGDSMFPKIEDGDIIQVHKQDAVDDGSIAVVLVDGEEGLVKKLVFSPVGVELHSINPMYPPMRFEGAETNRVRVVGLVTQVIKGINGRKINSLKMSDNKKELLDVIEKMNANELREFNKIYNEYLKSKE